MHYCDQQIIKLNEKEASTGLLGHFLESNLMMQKKTKTTRQQRTKNQEAARQMRMHRIQKELQCLQIPTQ